MYTLFYALGIFALGAFIVTFIQKFEERKPIRKLDHNPKRYYTQLEYMLSKYSKDRTVREFLISVAEDLAKNYDMFKRYPRDEHLSSIFGKDSYDKNREEALALCYLLSYHASSIIKEMHARNQKRFLELRADLEVCPPELYEPFRDVQNIVRSEEFSAQEAAFKREITEQLSRSKKFRVLFPKHTIEKMISLFSKYKCNTHIYEPKDITPEAIDDALEIIHRAESKLHDVTKE